MDKTASEKTTKKPAKKSHWLSIFGIIVLVIIILVGGWLLLFVAKPGMKNPIVQSAERLYPAIKEMQTQTSSQLESQAAFVTPADLEADPTGYDDRFVATEGVVSGEESSGVSQNIALNMFENEPYKGYVVDDAIVVLDITGTGPTLKDGSVIRAVGKLFVVNIEDIWKLPVVGPNLKKEFANVEGMSPTVIFLICNGIKVVSTPPLVPPAPEGTPPGAQGKPATTPSAAGTTPPATGTPPPAGGTTPPPAGGTPPTPPPPPPPAKGGK
jgi:hypothetical protein